jgi:hypothetical protein
MSPVNTVVARTGAVASRELHPDNEMVCMQRSIVNDSILTNCFEFQ